MVRSAALPWPFRCNSWPMAGLSRLGGAHMTDAKSDATGAAALALSTRAKTQDLAFSDSASPKSRAHVRALGGIGLTVQNLEWIRLFRPLGALTGRVERRLSGRRRLGLATLMRPFDAAIRLICPRIRPQDVQDLVVDDLPLERFLDEAPRLIQHYAVRPLWSREELKWLVGMASQNSWHGPLHLRSIRDRVGALVGCFVYYGGPGRSAVVLNLLAEKGRESKIFAAMLHDLDRIGCTDAVGRALPALMEGLAAQPMLSLRHKAFVCVITKHQDIVDAAERGDIYLGGLAGESWSRLMTDFY